MTSLLVGSSCHAQSVANSISFHVEHNSSTELQNSRFPLCYCWSFKFSGMLRHTGQFTLL